MKKVFIISLLFSPAALVLSEKTMNHSKKNIQPPTEYQKQINPGEIVYKKYCISCHQADGGGVPNMNPPLINTTYVLGDKDRLIKIILNGLNEKIEIDGEYFSNPMPALSILKDKQIADVLTYIRSNFGNKASPISTLEVKTVRNRNK